MSETLSGAQILCRTLVEEGVQYLFGYPGGAIMPFYHALGVCPELRHILVRPEQAAAHAADGYARASGRVGVCVATSGPGATNLVTGLATAHMASSPVLAITGQVSRPMIGPAAVEMTDGNPGDNAAARNQAFPRLPPASPRHAGDARRGAREPCHSAGGLDRRDRPAVRRPRHGEHCGLRAARAHRARGP